MRAELTARTNPVAAREIVSDREDYTEKTDVIGAAYVVIDTCLAESQFEEARKEAQRLENLLPDDPEALIAMFRVLSSTGDTDAGKYLERAITKIGPETPPESRMLVADCLSQAGRDDDVVDLLYKHVDYTLDSLALQLLIQSAANADRRKILNEALTAVPDEIRDLPFYRRARTALALCTGNIDAAEQEVRGFLAVEPRNLNMHLQLLQLLARREKIDQLRTEVARPASDFDGKPRDFVFFAQFKDKFGSWQEAHDIAYRYWLLNQSDPNVCLAYTGLFLLPGHSEEIDIAPQEIGTNMAVSIENADRTKDIYVLEYDPSLRPNLKYLPPNHKLTECLLKHKVGDEVELPDGSNGRIVWIKPKYLHAFHEILESFGNVFPDVSGIERVRFNTDAPEGLQPIIERVRGRHDAIESVFEAYERGQVPISIAGQVLGFDPVKSLGALISSGRTLRVCEGTEPERGAALSAIDSNGGGGCVVDAITLQIMRRLSLCEAVAAVCGPIRIVDATASRLQQEAEELAARINDDDMSLFWKDGQIYREIIDSTKKHHALRELQDDRQWLEKNAKIIPAQGTTDLSRDLRSLVARFGSAFIDDAIAAQGAGVILLSEDQSLRALATAEFGIKTTWLQPVLMRARDNGHITQSEYREAIRWLIESRFEFVSVDSDMLIAAISGASAVPLPKVFTTVASRIGGAKADMRSHLGVAFGAIKIFWNDRNIPDLVKSAAVGSLLENLTKERPIEHVLAILVKAIRFGKSELADLYFNQYVENWRIGHFIVIPKQNE
ncbi:MAG: hypothetical protein U1E81_06350 [Xanthobacteraceae bacterium]